MIRRPVAALLAAVPLALASGAQAQSDQPQDGERRTRVSIGVQAVPSYPGADHNVIRPLIDVVSARGDSPFEFEAADESFSIPLYRHDGLELGTAMNFVGSRRRSSVGADVDSVGFSVELGGAAAYWFTPELRIRSEVRKAVSGHNGLVSDLSLDYVVRDGDRWLVAVGPRVSLSDARFRRAYFGVSARDRQAGLAAYSISNDPIHSVGISSTATRQLSTRWGLYGYVAYNRLVGDAADSPFVTQLGSRNQFSGGLALSYSFGRGVR
ncbi:MipA/OmpV family protein [Sphingomonas sp. RS6]